MTMQQTAPVLILLGNTDTHQASCQEADVLTVGMTRRDKRQLLKAEADRLLISYPDLLDLMAAAVHERAKVQAQAEQSRITDDHPPHAVVRQAYWDSSDPASAEFYAMSNALAECCEIDAPTAAQLRTLFFLLPSRLIRSGIRWGFDDCDVRGAIWLFVEENVQTIKDALQPTQ